jgi:DNA repair protein RecN (Recombination protein N)
VSGLLELAVEELALIERLRIRLEPGFTVITGETGAGKSLLIDALGLALGLRADPRLVRSGAASTRVEALFDLPDREEPLIVVREVVAAGRSLARLDDETVTAAHLAATVGPLVEIHGQHQQHRLLAEATQRDLLDAFGAHADLRAAVAAAVESWAENRRSLDALIDDPAELERRIALAEHTADEVEAAAVRPGEVTELRAALARAANAETIARLAASIRGRLTDEGQGARDLLARATQEARELARLDPRAGELAGRLAGLKAEVEDAAEELRRSLEGAEAAEAATSQLEERLGTLYSLMRKYGDDEAAVLAQGAIARAEAERLRGTAAERQARLAEDVRLEAAARSAAADLTAARERAAERLGREVGEALTELGLRRAALAVEVRPAALSRTGADGVRYQLAANPGEPPRPLAEIASGGELSRISLAIKSVLAGADATPTLVFDEIDAGIGARSADPVGRMLHRLAGDHQVIVVTHLAQIAAHADHHLLIEKGVERDRTVTRLRTVEGDERVTELAIMLGGAEQVGPALAARPKGGSGATRGRKVGPSAAAMTTARELLARARVEPAPARA